MPEQLGASRRVVTQLRAREVERPGGETARLDRRRLAARGAVEHHRPARPQSLERRVEGRRADAVVDDVRLEAAGALAELVVAEDLLGAGRAGELGLLVGRGRGQDVPAAQPHELRQQVTHTARGGVHDDAVARRHGIRGAAEVLRRDPLEQDSDRLLVGHPVANGHGPLG